MVVGVNPALEVVGADAGLRGEVTTRPDRRLDRVGLIQLPVQLVQGRRVIEVVAFGGQAGVQDMGLLAPSRLIDAGVEGLDVVVALGPLPGGLLLSCEQLLGVGGDLPGHILSLLGGRLR